MQNVGNAIELEIESMAFGGKAIGRADGFVFFVEGALPGERVRAEVERVRRDHGFARAIEVLRASPERVDPPCPAFGRCGGCAFLHWTYAGQCKAKTRFVRDALRRFPEAAAALPDLEPTAAPFGFRNRMGFSIARDPADGRIVVGLHERASFDRVVSASSCLLPTPGIMRLRARMEEALQACGALPRRVDIRESRHTGERMVNLFTEREPDRPKALTEALDDVCDHLFVTVGPEGPDHRVRRRQTRLKGSGVLVERMGGLDFEIGPDTFFQTNTAEADRMFGHVRELVERLSPVHVVDLYAGAGAIALLMAAPGRAVLGCEACGPAVRAARRNIERNRLRGVEIVQTTVEKLKPGAPRLRPDVLVVDPPRDGLTPAARKTVLDLHAANLIYVSCNPSTLARDLDALSGGGYEVGTTRAFDLFPQTAHVECVVELRR